MCSFITPRSGCGPKAAKPTKRSATSSRTKLICFSRNSVRKVSSEMHFAEHVINLLVRNDPGIMLSPDDAGEFGERGQVFLRGGKNLHRIRGTVGLIHFPQAAGLPR